MRLRNPIGPKVSLGNGYAYQSINIGRTKGFNRGYVKVWLRDRVIDTALSVDSARQKARRHAEKGLWKDD